MTTTVLSEAFFLPNGRGGRLFAMYRFPPGVVRGALLFVHPFAEEMNRARRMVALAVQNFVEAGWAVLQLDLTGCGDSSDEITDVAWDTWLDDVSAGVWWLRSRHSTPLVLWGLRAGCLVLSDWIARANEQHPVLYWQPVSSGRQHVTHFLMMKVAGELPGGQDARTVLQGMRSRLDMGGSVEVAGYGIGTALVKGFEQSVLDFPGSYAGQVNVFEINSLGRDGLSPVLAGFVGRWRQAGVDVRAEVAKGPAFWLTQEVTVAPDLIQRSRQALEQIAF